MKQAGLILLLALAVIAGFACGGGQPAATGPVIGFVQLLESPQLDQGYAGFKKALADAGFVAGTNLTIDYRCPQGEMATLPLIIDGFVDRRVQLIGTSTTPCMIAAAQRVRDIPVVITVAFGPADNGITPTPANMTGYYNEFDAVPFVKLLQECMPGLRTIGLPYSSGEANAAFAAKKITAACEVQGIKVLLQPITSVNELSDVGQALAGQGAQAFVAASDNAVYAGLAALVPIAREKKMPIFAADPAMTQQGAAVGWGIDFFSWGYESGQVAAELLRGKTAAELPLRASTGQQVAISEENCRAQGLTVPATVRARAQQPAANVPR